MLCDAIVYGISWFEQTFRIPPIVKSPFVHATNCHHQRKLAKLEIQKEI